MSESIITFDKVNKWYGNNFHVLRDIDLDVAKGERIVICGPSGSGKSTLIRCINRLEEHQQGHLYVDGIELTDDVKAIDETRKRGMEFHAWINPYRAVATAANQGNELMYAPNHVSRVHPEWMLTVGSVKILNPGPPQVREPGEQREAVAATRC